MPQRVLSPPTWKEKNVSRFVEKFLYSPLAIIDIFVDFLMNIEY